MNIELLKAFLIRMWEERLFPTPNRYREWLREELEFHRQWVERGSHNVEGKTINELMHERTE